MEREGKEISRSFPFSSLRTRLAFKGGTLVGASNGQVRSFAWILASRVTTGIIISSSRRRGVNVRVRVVCGRCTTATQIYGQADIRKGRARANLSTASVTRQRAHSPLPQYALSRLSHKSLLAISILFLLLVPLLLSLLHVPRVTAEIRHRPSIDYLADFPPSAFRIRACQNPSSKK